MIMILMMMMITTTMMMMMMPMLILMMFAQVCSEADLVRVEGADYADCDGLSSFALLLIIKLIIIIIGIITTKFIACHLK